MKIILSPSKTQDMEALNQTVQIPDKEKTQKLFNALQSLSKVALGKTLKIKGKMLGKTYDLYQSFAKTNPGIRVRDCYKGVVFEQIKTDDLNDAQEHYLNNHLVVLSAMYGYLKPSDVIWPYRLDMGHSPKGLNLYAYWQDTIDAFFKDEDIIINLASNEFSKMLKNHPMTNIHFLDQTSDGKLKVIGFNAKKARGMMANLLIHQEISDIDIIKKLTVEQYRYNDHLSDRNNLYFTKTS